MQIEACIHTDCWEATGQGHLITRGSSAQVNYPAFHNKDRGPILSSFLLETRNTVNSWISTRADTVCLQNRNQSDTSLLFNILSVALWPSLSPVCMCICLFIVGLSFLHFLWLHSSPSPSYFYIISVLSLWPFALLSLPPAFPFILVLNLFLHSFSKRCLIAFVGAFLNFPKFVNQKRASLCLSVCYKHVFFWIFCDLSKSNFSCCLQPLSPPSVLPSRQRKMTCCHWRRTEFGWTMTQMRTRSWSWSIYCM